MSKHYFIHFRIPLEQSVDTFIIIVRQKVRFNANKYQNKYLCVVIESNAKPT